MSSVAQLEAEISTYFHEGGGYVRPLIILALIKQNNLRGETSFDCFLGLEK